MPERPLLLFSEPGTADRTKRPPPGPPLPVPPHDKQRERLDPQFHELQEAFNKRQIEIRRTTPGIEPEQVLVLETVGGVQDFITAVRKVKGFEWMNEINIDEIELDEDFYDQDDKNKSLSGQLYLIMFNQKALQQMLSLWKKYKADKNIKFEEGLNKFKDLFSRLNKIRLWGPADRLSETGLIEAWKEDLREEKQEVRLEIELWFRKVSEKREEAQNLLKTLIKEIGGEMLAHCIIEDIAYHALLAEIPADQAQKIIDHKDTNLVKCDDVMFFSPTGQMAARKQPEEDELSDHDDVDTVEPTGAPVVAVLDGLPLENHELIAPWVRVDDPDNYASKYPAEDRKHGTAMVSLITRGDLNDSNARGLPHPVYVRPIMKPVLLPDGSTQEEVSDDFLLVDYVHQAVRRIFADNEKVDAVAPTVRIINFSIGDFNRQFVRTLSPLARLLDWLSTEYKVLFVISAGNHKQRIEIDMLKDDFKALTDKDQQNKIVWALYEDSRNRRPLSPGESINSITVGCLHNDLSETKPSGSSVRDLFMDKLPSPVSPFGNGYRRSVKPDLLSAGGRVLYASSLETHKNMVFEVRDTIAAPGNKVASPGRQSGELRKVVHSCGTSNATALTSRAAAICHDVLLEVFKETAPDNEFDDELRRSCLVPLIKSMIIHGCSWGETGENLRDIIKMRKNGKKIIDEHITKWLGYGVPAHERVLECTAQRVTLLGYGELADGKAHIFGLPLPPALDMQKKQRRLTVTLAWLSSVAPNTQRYRSAQLWFEADKGNKIFEKGSQQVRSDASQRGTVQHKIFESHKTVETADKSLSIKVNCRKDAAEIQDPVSYGLAVTFEVTEEIDVDIYEEIRARITPPVEIEPTEHS